MLANPSIHTHPHTVIPTHPPHAPRADPPKHLHTGSDHPELLPHITMHTPTAPTPHLTISLAALSSISLDLSRACARAL